MLTFSTRFALQEGIDLERVDAVGREWLHGSPHTAIGEQVMAAPVVDGCWEVAIAGERARAILLSDDDGFRYGVKHQRTEDDGVRWTTEVVAIGDAGSASVSVQVFHDSGVALGTLPPARKPYIVRQLMPFAGQDGALQLQDDPVLLSPDDVDFAADLLLGQCGNVLPVVYVSANSAGGFAINPTHLAHWVGGMAHVFVEPDPPFSLRLMSAVGGINAYKGAIGIYWSDGDIRELILPWKYDNDWKSIGQAVVSAIRRRAVGVRVPRELTWSNLKERLAIREIDRLKAQGSQDVDSYVAVFDQEIKAKARALEDAESEIRRLSAEIDGLKARVGPIDGKPLLARGAESDFFQSEVHDIIVDALEASLRNVLEPSRRHDVIADVVEANPRLGVAADYADRIKRLLSTYRRMDAATKQQLEELGFDIDSDGKHHKVTFRGDPRYMSTLPKTSSDNRAGKNIVASITKLVF